MKKLILSKVRKNIFMSWTCPNCNRTFKSKNQSHSCAIIDVEYILAKKSEKIKHLFNFLIEKLENIGQFTFVGIKSAILLANQTTFVAIKLKKEYILLEFVLDKCIDEFPVFKTFRISKNKVAHYIIIEDTNDISDKILDWLKQAYNLANV